MGGEVTTCRRPDGQRTIRQSTAVTAPSPKCALGSSLPRKLLLSPLPRRLPPLRRLLPRKHPPRRPPLRRLPRVVRKAMTPPKVETMQPRRPPQRRSPRKLLPNNHGQVNRGALRNPPGGAFLFALALLAPALPAPALPAPALLALAAIGKAPPQGQRGGACWVLPTGFEPVSSA